MPVYTDQMGNDIMLPAVPQRIISLVPSQTELLYELGLDEEVTGITKFCVHPEKWFKSKPRIGGTKTVNIDKVRQLQPELIIANKEENVKEQIDELGKIAPVWVSDVNSLEEALSMIISIGTIVNRPAGAGKIVEKIKAAFTSFSYTHNKLPAVYLIWKEPYMTVGGDTFISDMMQYAGFVNAFADLERYPVISTDDIYNSRCEIILLSSEPYPFKEEHIHELKRSLPAQKIVLVDGEMFSWYGSRLKDAPSYFSELIKRIK